MDPIWRVGCFLGRSWNSDQNFIGLSSGAVTRARSLVRLVENKRWSRERLQRIQDTPFTERPQALDKIEEDLVPHQGPPLPPDQQQDTDMPLQIRRLKIPHKDLRRVGYSASCPKCNLHQIGDHTRAANSNHTEQCRRRVYAELRKIGAKKLFDAEQQGRASSNSTGNNSTSNTPPTTIADDGILPPTTATNAGDGFLSPPALPGTGRSNTQEPSTTTADGFLSPPTLPTGLLSPPTLPTDQPDQQQLIDDTIEFLHEMDAQQTPDVPAVSQILEVTDEADDNNSDIQDYVALQDVLQVLGVSAVDATRFICSISGKSDASFIEVYGQGRLAEMANQEYGHLNIKGLDAFDLTVRKPNGDFLDFSLRQIREEAEAIVRMTKPEWLIGCPPCRAFSILNQNLNLQRMDPTRRRRLLREGRRKFTVRRQTL